MRHKEEVWNGIPLLIVGLVLISIPGLGAESKWESLLQAIDTSRDRGAIAGVWQKTSDEVRVSATNGARLTIPVEPNDEYDFRASFSRVTGRDSIGLIVVHGGKQVVFEVDAWGSHLGGFQNLDGRSIRENPTRRTNVVLENNRRYTITVEVRKDGLRGMLNGKEICRHRTDGGDLSVPELWAVPHTTHLGLVAWNSETIFHSVEARALNGDSLLLTQNRNRSKASGSDPKPNPVTSSGTATAKSARNSTDDLKSGSKGTKEVALNNAKSATAGRKTPTQESRNRTVKRVLIVIANYHFFYREYSEPREELERAGIEVKVAAGRKAICRAHAGSGQTNGDGSVQPDFALSEVSASDYDALLFSGGWGASAYQFAFNGRYQDSNYNGDRSTKIEANRLINEFLSQDKYVCALCNGVSVLAWARVDGKSPLNGKRVCAPTRQAPAGIYNGRPGQPSCRWHPEANGAVLSPAGSIGQPGTPVDDVLVDGKIITGEDDPSAREMGRRIAEVLRN